MSHNVLCAIIKSNDTIFNISQMYKHCKKSITGDIDYTIFFYDPKMAEKYTPIIKSISNFHNVSKFSISTDHKSFFNKDYYLLYFLDQTDYLAICENKFIKDKFSLIFCSGVGHIDNTKSITEPQITYVPEHSNTVCPVQSYDDKLLRYKGEEPIDINMKICGRDNIVKWLPLRQRLYSKDIICNDKIYLYQQYFVHSEENRRSEIDYCLEQNKNNKYIDKILLLNEEKYKNNLLSSSKISQELINRRIKFSDILRHAKYNLNGYIVFSNSDIFFDNTINKIKYGTISTEKSIDTICRYEYNKGNNLMECKLRPVPRFHSQDGWIIHTNFLKDITDSQINKNFNFPLGIPGCDHKILAEFNNLGFNVYNNPQDIRGYHYHTSQIRDYNPTRLLPPPYAYSQPILDFNTKHEEFMHTSGLFWQYPVITEKTFYLQNKNDSRYLPIPWATIIDKFSNQLEAVYKLIINWYDPDLNYYTCCQTIHLDKLLPLMSKVGVKTIYTPHKEINKNAVQVDENKIELLPCPLYAVNVEDSNRNNEFKDVDLINRETKYLYSFKGAWEPHYISKIRQNIFNMSHQEDTVIENIGKWHFVKDVYSDIQSQSGKIDNSDDKQKRTSEYNKLLLDSKFSLCPSGAGPNSIRFWESLAVGCIPVLLADTLELPDHKDWDKAILRVSEHNVDNLEILRDITDDEIIQRRKKCIEIYNHFKNNFVNNNELKVISTKKKMILFTNCHGEKYIKLFERDSNIKDIFDIDYIVSYQQLSNFDNLRDRFMNADVLIINNIKQYDKFTIGNIRKNIKSDCMLIVIPFIRFEGYWLPENYKNLKYFKENSVSNFPDIKIENTKKYLSESCDSSIFLPYFYNCLKKLKQISDESDIDFYDFFIENHLKYPMFRDKYHPTKNIIEYIAGKIINIINKKYSISYVNNIKLEKDIYEYGHYKPIKDSVKNMLNIEYDLDKIFIWSRYQYINKILDYERNKNDIVSDLDDMYHKLNQ